MFQKLAVLNRIIYEKLFNGANILINLRLCSEQLAILLKTKLTRDLPK